MMKPVPCDHGPVEAQHERLSDRDPGGPLRRLDEGELLLANLGEQGREGRSRRELLFDEREGPHGSDPPIG
ncbi:MAG: hypothetical protein ACOCYX_01335, partial [Spirochaetota bacterium]